MRKFNRSAYNAHDKRNKEKIVKIMESTNKYVLIGDINDELYKECDVKLKHIDTGEIFRFENETRESFDQIVNEFDTIHIPIRKENTLADFYIVWKPSLTQFILIRRNVLLKYKTNQIDVSCHELSNATSDYVERFIDIPKNECEWFVIGQNYKMIPMNWPPVWSE